MAAWLVDLFAPSEQAESITGDLLEEFFGNSIMIVTGGGLVRNSRSAAASRSSPA
jgi:hypothetical protein